MIAKLIVWDLDRKSACRRMVRALQELVVEGVTTTTAFHLEVLQTPDFVNSTYNTRWIGERASRERSL
jgi:acetyl/propionyl-CoA carboxylase alpha subunit